MVRIKNTLPGILHIPGANLRLYGKGTAEVDAISPAIQRAVDAGRIEVLQDDYKTENNQSSDPLPAPPADFDKLDEADAIEYVEDENDPAVIKSILREEVRPSVNDALKARLEEISNAGQ